MACAEIPQETSARVFTSLKGMPDRVRGSGKKKVVEEVSEADAPGKSTPGHHPEHHQGNESEN
jgi:hypothetical protein